MGNLWSEVSWYCDLPKLLEKINRNSIGMDDYLSRVFDLHETTASYPPYNLLTSQQCRI